MLVVLCCYDYHIGNNILQNCNLLVQCGLMGNGMNTVESGNSEMWKFIHPELVDQLPPSLSASISVMTWAQLCRDKLT